MTLDSTLTKIGDNISKILRGEYKPYHKFFYGEKEDKLQETIIRSKIFLKPFINKFRSTT
jgi:hypothetical protein